jgi:hypothetical protein
MFALYLANQLRGAFSSFGILPRAAPQTPLGNLQSSSQFTRGTGAG